MIAKTGDLAQLCGRYGPLFGLGLLLFLPACREAVAPTAPDAGAARAKQDQAPEPAPAADWVYATSLDEFHAIWTARLAASARADLDPAALLPYVDAVERDGASWGVKPEDIAFVFMDSTGHAHRVAGAAHPAADRSGWERESAMAPLDPASPLRREDLASGFRMTGAVFRGGDCAVCHDGPDDQLLGALVYEFREIPDD